MRTVETLALMLVNIVMQCLFFYKIMKNIYGAHMRLLRSTGDRNIVFYSKEEKNLIVISVLC